MADQNLKIQLTAIDKTQRAFAAVRGGLKRVSGSILNVRTALVGLAGAAGLQVFAKQIDDLAKASSRLGLTVNEIQSLQFAASQTGASAEELEKGLTRFSRAISEASTGIGTGLRSFEALGVTVTDAEGSLRPTSELLSLVSDRLSQIENPADRVRIAFDLFGRSGVNLVNTLQEGSTELGKLQDEFNDLTLLLTGKQAQAVEKANDQFDKLARFFSSIGQQITATVLPVIAKLATFLTVNIVRGFANAIKGARDFVNFFVDAFNQIAEKIDVLPKLDEVVFGKRLEMNLRKIAGNFLAVNGEIKELGDRTPIAADAVDGLAAGFERVNESTKSIFERFPDYSSKFKELDVRADAVSDKLGGVGDAAKTMQEKMNDAKANGIDRLEDGLIGLVQGTQSVSQAFRSMALSVVNDLTRMYIQQQITNPLRSFFGLTPKAIGGSVQAGQPYMVGERGAEMFVPNQAGSIVPNNQIGGGAVTVNQTINLSTGVAQTVRAEVMNMLPQIEMAAKGAVLDAKRRGGSFAKFV